MSTPQAPSQAESEEELKKSLQRLGFTDHEARAYVALSDAFPATAYEVAQRSGLPRANAYAVLGSLAAKGAVQEVMRDPVKYAPVEAAEYFGQRAKQTSELCAQVTGAMKARTRTEERIFVWAARGGGQVRDKLRELISTAGERIWIKGSFDMIREQLQELVTAAERGVRVVLIVFGEDATELRVHPAFTVFLHEGRGTHRGASKTALTLTTDGTTFMIASFTDPVGASYGRNPAIVYVVETMILHEVYLAEIYDKIGPVLDDMFGEHFSLLRGKYRPPTMGLAMLAPGAAVSSGNKPVAEARLPGASPSHRSPAPKPPSKKSAPKAVRKA